MNKTLTEELLNNPSIISINAQTSSKRSKINRRVLFICAMDEELEGFRDALEFMDITYQAVSYKYGYFYSFEYLYANCRAYAVGISYFSVGRLFRAIQQFAPDEIICIGSLAGINKQPFGEVILSNNCVCDDIDLSMFGYVPGTIEKQETNNKFRLMVSGSRFISSQSDIDRIKKKFPDAQTYDMETFMFAQVCKDLEIPFIACKAVSDSGDDSADSDFISNVKRVSAISGVYGITLTEKSSIREMGGL